LVYSSSWSKYRYPILKRIIKAIIAAAMIPAMIIIHGISPTFSVPDDTPIANVESPGVIAS
jgi:hypothetical protein